MIKVEKGFTLFEVLVSMFITGVALLGLAQLEVYILKSSQSSFNYTVATIRANSLVNTMWADLCNAQSASISTYTEVFDADMTAIQTYSSAIKTSTVTVTWNDPRFKDDDLNNTLTLSAKFPDSGCGS